MSLVLEVENAAATRQLLRRLRTAGSRLMPDVEDGLVRGMQGFRKEFLSQVKPQGLKRPKARFKGGKPLWTVKTRGKSLGDLSVRLFPRAYHGGLLRFEKGGRFTPRDAQSFAIPLPWVRKRGGRGTPKKGYYSPETFRRKFPRRRLIREIIKGKKYLVEYRKKRGKWERIQAVFILLKSIPTRHRLGLGKTWRSSRSRANFLRRLNENIKRGLKREFGETAVK